MSDGSPNLLKGIVEVDETYVGGKRLKGRDVDTRETRLLLWELPSEVVKLDFKLLMIMVVKHFTSLSERIPHRIRKLSTLTIGQPIRELLMRTLGMRPLIIGKRNG